MTEANSTTQDKDTHITHKHPPTLSYLTSKVPFLQPLHDLPLNPSLFVPVVPGPSASCTRPCPPLGCTTVGATGRRHA